MDEQREDLEAIQARLRTLQAEIEAERQHASAAEAVIAASRAAVEEAGLARPDLAPPRRGVRRWGLGLGLALVLCASVLVGLAVRQARMLEAVADATAAYRRQGPLAERELIELERRLSQLRVSPPRCSGGQGGYGQAGSNPGGTRSVDPLRGL